MLALSAGAQLGGPHVDIRRHRHSRAQSNTRIETKPDDDVDVGGVECGLVAVAMTMLDFNADGWLVII